ncbi:putative F-box protein At3g10240 [Aegilops tauschii subsp. strangulata]|uniref:F-box associated beta-propeller type 3 domain-containing protein n=3 Tax=Triticinae TaxID=1648030 RepID=A0A453T4P8_AEGTS|nr:F-box protein At5g49610-like [Aegilops tauschii subsp. strangulata]XP_044443397.1 F-box protein At5g49610-like [Triticum aestivum]
MPDRKGATRLEDLPKEMMHQILIRLPGKAVGRCRAVIKSWCSATSTPEFKLEHHRRQPLLPIVNGEGRPASYVVLGDAGAGTSNQELWPLVREDKQNFNILIGSCDGFFIIFRRGPSQFCICNPVTRKAALLPEPSGQYNFLIGFYIHHPTGEYRVLWVSTSHLFSKITLYILTVGYDKPRHAIVRMPAVSSPSMQQKLLTGLSLSSKHSSPVHHRGSLHWCLHGAGDVTGDAGDIIVFDTEAESFRLMHSPAQSCSNRKLFDMKGTLAFWAGSTPSFTSMDVWVMQDYEAEIWAFKYRIELSTVEASRQLYLSSYKKKKKTPHDSAVQSFDDMAVLNEREVLIRFNDKHVLRCDIDGKFLGLVNIAKSQYCMSLTQHHLQESILPIPSHEMQG